MICSKCGKEVKEELKEIKGVLVCKECYEDIVIDILDGKEMYIEKGCEYCGDGGCFHCEPQRFININN